VEREGLEARQGLRWSNAEAAENRARRLITVQEGLWKKGTHLESFSQL
jgi:hypothetical protein